MKFGSVPVAQAEGGILAHSSRVGGGVLKKGRVLSAMDIAALEEAGRAEVVIAHPERGDVLEDLAADRIAAAMVAAPGLSISAAAAFTGRANLYADAAGVLEIDRDVVDRLNAIDEGITLASLPQFSRVAERQMLGTVKIIPYGVPGAAVAEAEAILRGAAPMRVHPVRVEQVQLILTRTPGMKQGVLDKGADAVLARLAALGIEGTDVRTVPHDVADLAAAIAESSGDMVLILTGSATSDRGDTGPSALVAAGGRLERFGMPVDPGNLLFLGAHGARPVVGLPGCARSPKLNGADWVIERLACGLEVSAGDIAGMGVGGLLKEIPSRPQPRSGGAQAPVHPFVSVVLLAAGGSTRMGGRDKLLEEIDGQALVRRLAMEGLRSRADEVLCVVRGHDPERVARLDGLDVRVVNNPIAEKGMATSIAAGLAAVDARSDAALIMLGDMPDVGAGDLDRLIAGFDPGEGRAIVRAVSADGRPGHPVLFGRRFFEALGALEGDEGARGIIAEHRDFVADVALPGTAALTDLDTPEAWTAWRAVRRAAG